MKAYYCDHFVLPLPATHSFPMTKYRRLRERVIEEGIVALTDLVEPQAASMEHLTRVHDPDYVESVVAGTLDVEHQRRIGFPWSPAMVERSRRSVGGTIAAALTALGEGIAVNLAGGTHHAFRERGEGYCVFNDIAVAVRVLQAEAPHLARIAVVDCDVHQGNGTAAIFRDDASVFTFSIHGEKNFPFRKEASDLDVTLPDGTGDEEYLRRLADALDVVARQRPDFVFYLAGADPFEGDRLGRLALSIEGLRVRDRMVFDRFAAVPIATCMGGGYCPDVETIVTIHANTIRELSMPARLPTGV
jgi:acetoin utilization deacetylase AcuC-like enzyme